MAKSIILVKKSVLIGSFSNKVKMWECVQKHEGCDNSLIIKTSDTKYTDCDYSKIARYMRLWGMIRLYLKQDIEDGLHIETLVSKYKVWEAIINEEIT